MIFSVAYYHSDSWMKKWVSSLISRLSIWTFQNFFLFCETLWMILYHFEFSWIVPLYEPPTVFSNHHLCLTFIFFLIFSACCSHQEVKEKWINSRFSYRNDYGASCICKLDYVSSDFGTQTLDQHQVSLTCCIIPPLRTPVSFHMSNYWFQLQVDVLTMDVMIRDISSSQLEVLL